MAWNVAAYTVALASLLAAAAVSSGILYVCLLLRKWDRTAVRLERKAEAALADCLRMAEEVTETTEMLRRTAGGFMRLSDGARAIGEAAESVAQAAVDLVALWREPKKEEEGFAGILDWAALGRRLGQLLRLRLMGREEPDESSPAATDDSGTSADHRQGV